MESPRKFLATRSRRPVYLFQHWGREWESEVMAADRRKRSRDEFGHNLLASGLSGAVSITVLNPLDCLRVRWQASSSGKQSEATGLLGFARRIGSHEGWWRGLMLPGLSANVMAVTVCNSLRFASYPVLRDSMNAALHSGDDKFLVGSFAASLLAGAASYAAASPFYLQKTKLQGLSGLVNWKGGGGRGAASYRETGRSVPYQSLAQSLRETLAFEGRGLAGLWRGTGVLVVRGSCLSVGQLVGYDQFKTVAKRQLGAGADGPALHVVASVSSAFWAATLSIPLDVVMARYQTAPESSPFRAAGPWGCTREVLRRDGAAAFFRGWLPMFARLAPMYILGTTIFEQSRRLMGVAYFD